MCSKSRTETQDGHPLHLQVREREKSGRLQSLNVHIIRLLHRPPKMASANPEPVLIDSNSETCTHFFSFHTPQVCEQTVSTSSGNSILINRMPAGTSEPCLSPVAVLLPVQVRCSVQNGSDLIELTPLIRATGYYAATDEAVDPSDESPDFYINICQPLNPIPGVSCPPGAAVCMDPDDGPPVVKQSHLSISFVLLSPHYRIFCTLERT